MNNTTDIQPPSDPPVGSMRLLGCPFCGSRATGPDDISVNPSAKDWWQIMCADENKIGCNAWRSGETPQAVAKKWNMRFGPSMEKAQSLLLKIAKQQKCLNELYEASALLRLRADQFPMMKRFSEWERHTAAMRTAEDALGQPNAELRHGEKDQ